MDFRRNLKALSSTKLGKLLPILIIALLVGTASATVFTNFYSDNTVTVRTHAIRLALGSDVSGSPACTSFPCASGTLETTKDFATLNFSMFKSATHSPQPATYFTDLLHVVNDNGTHSILSVKVTSDTAVGSPFGKIVIYYCTAQTDDPTGCLSSLTLTSATTGTVYGGTDTIVGAGTRYIEVVAYAGSGASIGDKVVLKIQVQWA